MTKLNNSHVNVVGDSIESCLVSRKLSDNPAVKEVHHYTTGALGGVFIDDVETVYLGLLSKSQVNKIQQYLPDEVFEEVSESYLKIPHKKLNFQNSYDGYIRFPFTANSFENEFDMDDIILEKYGYTQYVDKLLEYKNINKIFKEMFEDHFYMNIIKKIGTNIWNLNISQLDPSYVYKGLLHLEHLDTQEPIMFYRPKIGYSGICKKLLEKDNITIVKENRINIKNKTKAQIDIMTYYCEYYDFYYDFLYGAMEYINPIVEMYKKNNLNTENYVKIQTPYDKKYGVYYQLNNNTYRVFFENYIINTNSYSAKQLIPSIANMKRYSEYKKMADLMINSRIIL